MSTAFPIIRLAANVVGSLGVAKVVGDVIKNNTNVVTTMDQIKVVAGSLVIGSMIVDHASNHVNEQINNAHAWWQDQKDKIEKDKE
jgi:hypothetical protein